MNTRQRWLALALLVTVAAAFWPVREDSDSLVEPVEQSQISASAERPAMEAGTTSQSVTTSERLAGMQKNLFPKQTWVPPPKPYVPPPPPPPQPPPLPFKFLGRWIESGHQTLFLMQGERPISIEPGMVLSDGWRVDEITDRTVVFTYLPLNMQSTLGISP